MEINFKFEIGDTVVEKQVLALREGEKAFYYNREVKKKISPERGLGFPRALRVFERQMIQCYAAVQMLYFCRSFSGSADGDKIYKFTEPELEAFDYRSFADVLLREWEEAGLLKEKEDKPI